MLPRTFLPVPNNRFNVDELSNFGPVQYLTTTHLSPFEGDEIMRNIRLGLKRNQYDPEKDYLVLTGNSVVLAYTMAVFVTEFPKFKMLIFDARNSLYCPREFTLLTAKTEAK